MRLFTRITALMMILLLAVIGSGASSALAQDDAGTPEEASVFDDLTQLEGLERAVGRDWEVDYEAIMTGMASPDADADAEDFAMPTGTMYVSAAILQFDGEDNAEAAFDKARDEFESQSMMEGIELEEIDVDGMSDNTVALGATQEDETLGNTNTTVILTQEDEYIYLSIGVAVEDESEGTVVDIVNHMKDADAGDGDGEFHDDGTSEGGLWDKLPAADDEVVGEGLIATDTQIYPDAGTPEA
jgi:hypothetical protein